MVLDIQTAAECEILRDLAEGIQRTELYAKHGDLAAATDLLLESVINEDAPIGYFWQCFRELRTQAETAGAWELAAWLREIDDWYWSFYVDAQFPQLMHEVEEE